jgi:hypothetical protein
MLFLTFFMLSDFHQLASDLFLFKFLSFGFFLIKFVSVV